MTSALAISTLHMSHDEWLAARQDGIGSSDAASVIGIGKMCTYDLWRLKTGRLKPPNLQDDPHVEWGSILEDPVARRFAKNHPELRVQRRNAILRSETYPFALANLDRKAFGEVKYVVEVKTAGYPDDWGDSGTDEIPYYHVPQVQHQLAVTGYRYAFVPVLIGGWDYREYVIEADNEYISELMERERCFWDHVLNDTPPEPNSLEDILAMFPSPSGTREATVAEAQQVAELKRVRETIKDLKGEEGSLKSSLALAFGEFDTLTVDNKPIATFKSKRTSTFNSTAHAEDHPELHEQYMLRGTTREMRTK